MITTHLVVFSFFDGASADDTVPTPTQSAPGSAAARITAGGGPSISSSGGYTGITQSSRNKGVTGRR